jgi:hypothetical protein
MDMHQARQQVYDRVAAHLRIQKRQSVNAAGNCAYRGENGLRCAMGIFISDEIFDPEIEGAAIGSLLAYIPKEVADTGVEFLSDLQMLHDVGVKLFDETTFYIPDLERALRVVADKWVLNYSKPGRRG